MKTSKVFIGFDSNLGDRKRNIERAIEELSLNKDIKVISISRLYETEPVGGPPQGNYLDGAMEIETALSPKALLNVLKEVEKKVGRTPSDLKWGPREIDLDILLYEDLILEEPGILKIPHPFLHLRAFMLDPLCEIAPDTVHPVLKRKVSEILSDLKVSSLKKV